MISDWALSADPLKTGCFCKVRKIKLCYYFISIGGYSYLTKKDTGSDFLMIFFLVIEIIIKRIIEVKFLIYSVYP